MNVSSEQPAGGGGDDQAEGQSAVMSMMSGTGADQPLGLASDEDEAAGEGWSLNSTAVIVGVVAVILIVATVVMRSFQAGTLDEDGVSPTVTAKFDQLLGGQGQGSSPADGNTSANGMQRDTDAIVAMFTSETNEQQVPIEYVKKNPFRLELPEAEPDTKPTDKANAKQQQAARLKKLRAKAKGLGLQSIMGGAQPVAVIDGSLYQTGDKVGPFTIAQIDRLRVKLKAGEETFTLTMDDESSSF